MKFQVIKEHTSNNIIPIEVKKEEKVRIGKKSDINDGWINWVYCYSLDGFSEGWTPE
jgi:hypothetical protein